MLHAVGTGLSDSDSDGLGDVVFDIQVFNSPRAGRRGVDGCQSSHIVALCGDFVYALV
jgi:hypothetical protein